MAQSPESLISDIQKTSAIAEYTYDISNVALETRQDTQEIISDNFTILDSGVGEFGSLYDVTRENAALSEQSDPGAAKPYLGAVRSPIVAIQQAPHRGAA